MEGVVTKSWRWGSCAAVRLSPTPERMTENNIQCLPCPQSDQFRPVRIDTPARTVRSHSFIGRSEASGQCLLPVCQSVRAASFLAPKSCVLSSLEFVTQRISNTHIAFSKGLLRHIWYTFAKHQIACFTNNVLCGVISAAHSLSLAGRPVMRT